MLNTLKRGINHNTKNPSLLNKNFSVFAKLKDYLRSGASSQSSIFGANMDPERIRVEIDDDMSSKKLKGKKPSNLKFSEEEHKIIDQLPKQIIKYERSVTLVQQEYKEREMIEKMIQEVQKEDATDQIKKTVKSKYKTIWEKLEYYETTAEGKIKLPYVFEEDGKTPKLYDSMKDYLEWKDKKIAELKENIFNKLTPMEYYMTQGKGTERPFTGDYWDTQKVGMYCCKVCTQRVFSSTHKYQAKGVGHATFWNFLPFALNFHDDHLEFPTPTQAIYKIQFANSKPKKRITCSNVKKEFQK
jgi:hypothetical protein